MELSSLLGTMPASRMFGDTKKGPIKTKPRAWARFLEHTSLLFFLCFPATIKSAVRLILSLFRVVPHLTVLTPYPPPLTNFCRSWLSLDSRSHSFFRKILSICISLFSSEMVKNPRSGLWHVGFTDGLGRRCVILFENAVDDEY